MGWVLQLFGWLDGWTRSIDSPTSPSSTRITPTRAAHKRREEENRLLTFCVANSSLNVPPPSPQGRSSPPAELHTWKKSESPRLEWSNLFAAHYGAMLRCCCWAIYISRQIVWIYLELKMIRKPFPFFYFIIYWIFNKKWTEEIQVPFFSNENKSVRKTTICQRFDEKRVLMRWWWWNVFLSFFLYYHYFDQKRPIALHLQGESICWCR